MCAEEKRDAGDVMAATLKFILWHDLRCCWGRGGEGEGEVKGRGVWWVPGMPSRPRMKQWRRVCA